MQRDAAMPRNEMLRPPPAHSSAKKRRAPQARHAAAAPVAAMLCLETVKHSTAKAHLLVHRPACEHHTPQERLDVAELDVSARRALQGVLHAEIQVQGIGLHHRPGKLIMV